MGQPGAGKENIPTVIYPIDKPRVIEALAEETRPH